MRDTQNVRDDATLSLSISPHCFASLMVSKRIWREKGDRERERERREGNREREGGRKRERERERRGGQRERGRKGDEL